MPIKIGSNLEGKLFFQWGNQTKYFFTPNRRSIMRAYKRVLKQEKAINANWRRK